MAVDVCALKPKADMSGNVEVPEIVTVAETGSELPGVGLRNS